jgi:hypothetical protein
VVKADGSWPRGFGFKPWRHILDRCRQFSSYYIQEKLKMKVAKWGTAKIYFTILSTDRFSEVMSSQQMLEFKTLHETFNPLHLYMHYAVLQSLEIHQSASPVLLKEKHQTCVLYFYHLTTHISIETISSLSDVIYI